MDAVTYPNTEVAQFLEKNFVCAKIDTTKEDPKTQEAIQKYCQVWTPTFISLNSDGREARRAVGYLPPDEFLPEMRMGLGHCHMLRKDFGKAFMCFEDITKNHPDSQCAPEALYWLGVSGYKDTHAVEDLLNPWKELKAKYPKSIWWTKASFIDKK